MAVVDGMLDVAEVKKGDVIYDLGSGDGRIVIRAAKRFGVRCVGVERDPRLIHLSRSTAKKEGVEHLVEFHEEDVLEVDVSAATLVTLYLSTQLNNKLRPGLRKQLKPGSRVVSHDFPIEGWTPRSVVKVPGGLIHRHRLYLWYVDDQPK